MKIQKKSETDKIIGRRIQEIRIKQGISAELFCAVIGISRRKLSCVEKGTSSLEYSVLCNIAKYLNVSTEFLLGRKDHCTPLK